MSTEFYLSLHKKAESLYPDDKKHQEEFVDGFVTKVANVLKDIGKDLAYNSDKKIGTEGRQTTMGSSLSESFWTRGMGQGIGQAVGKALVGGTVAAGFAGLVSLAKVVSNHALYNNYLKALNEAVQSNQVLKGADKSKVLNFGNTIFKFAPHVATDPNMLSSILANAIHGDGIDPMSIRMLTELESRYQDTKGDSAFNPKMWS